LQARALAPFERAAGALVGRRYDLADRVMPGDFGKRPKLAWGGIVAAAIFVVFHPSYAGASPPGWNHYQNARFGYSVDYPASQLRPLPEAGNGDGRKFEPIRGHADVAVWAGYDSDQSLDELAGSAEHDCVGGQATYKVIRDHKLPPFMALSCLKQGERVFYTKALRCKDVITQIEISYPKAESAIWDSVVRGMSSSLGAGCGLD